MKIQCSASSAAAVLSAPAPFGTKFPVVLDSTGTYVRAFAASMFSGAGQYMPVAIALSENYSLTAFTSDIQAINVNYGTVVVDSIE